MNIVLVHKSGGDFKLSDAYLLVAHIKRYWINSKVIHNIYCLTDAITEEKNLVGLTLLPLPNSEWPKWWSKINMFSPELKELRPFLYLDLDTIVLGSLDQLFPPKESEFVNKFIALRDFYRPNELASGLMYVPDTNLMDLIYSEYLISSLRFRGDQDFISYVIKKHSGEVVFWQDISKPDFITTFKPNREWRTKLPTKSAVVCFHGTPRIPEAAKSVDWVKSYVEYDI